ncbi:MAG: AbrB/MazE/SpoVT family DNA-binding domain-containing protein [Candidatus Dormiibacterota bacterium]
MRATIDAVGRVVIPKPLRDSLGLRPGSKVDISRYGEGVPLVPVGRAAGLIDEDGVRVVTGRTPLVDEAVFGLIDQERR